VKRALDIIIHLQAVCAWMGGRPAQALSEFYTSIFARFCRALAVQLRRKV